MQKQKPEKENTPGFAGESGAADTAADAAAERTEPCAQPEADARECGDKKELERLKSELDAAKDQLLRLAAEYDNFRKRTAKERESIYSDAVCATVAAFLPVIDNLERAGGYEGEGLKEGVLLIIKQLEDVCEKMGVEEIPAKDAAFDPELHSAVVHVEDENLPENTVAEVLLKGYKKGDKVIRHSVVKVAN